ncbi:MAG: hypothetical protein HYX67_01860 [Candidatus Melainabacteria bacterium]|nr:hypothetical protein [Candidatus Melainabacteria bacterium]
MKNLLTMKNLLIATAAIEVGAGVALIFFPAETTALLLAPVDQTVATAGLQRIAGAALLTIGVANWFAHYDEKSLAAKGIVGAMVIYNVGTVVVLSSASLQIRPVGLALWPAAILHVLMSFWCITSLLEKRKS